jgi:hypothetical protein
MGGGVRTRHSLFWEGAIGNQHRRVQPVITIIVFISIPRSIPWILLYYIHLKLLLLDQYIVWAYYYYCHYHCCYNIV